MFDAYTVKKVLPRLVIAAVLIQVSWDLFTGLIDIVNSLAWGVEGLIYAPFGGRENMALSDILVGSLGINDVPGTGIFAFLAIGAGATFAAASLGVMGFLSLALTALIALFIAFVFLSVRIIILAALLVIAPVALVAWILPNTDGLWKMWWESFSKLLLMYPLILLLIATGRALASIASNVASNSTVAFIVTIVAYFGPFFLIPKTFQVAGSAFGNITGMVNDRSRGVFDRLKKGRAERREDRLKRADSNSLWNSKQGGIRGRMAGLGNSAAGWTVNPGANYAYAVKDKKWAPGSRKGRIIAGQIEHAGVEQTQKLFQEMNNAGANDKTYRVLGGMHSQLSEATRDKLKDAGIYGKSLTSEADIMKAAEIMGESDSATEQIASGALHALAPRLSSLHSDAEMTKASIGGAATIGLAAHGFADGADLADSGNRLTQEGGLGFAQAVVSQAQLAGAKSRPDVKNGYGTVLKDGKFVDGMSAEGGRAAGLLRTIGQGDFVQAKGGFLKKMGGTIKEQISAGRSQEAQDAHKAVVNLRGSGMSDDDIKKQAGGQRLLQMAEQHGVAESLAEELKLAASPYSSSPVDTKGEAKRLVDELGMQGELESMVAEQKLMQEREAGAAGIGGGDSGGGDSGGGAAAAGGGE